MLENAWNFFKENWVWIFLGWFIAVYLLVSFMKVATKKTPDPE